MGSHLTFPGCNVGIARGSRKCLLAIIAMLPLHRRGRRWEDQVSWAARRFLERLSWISHKYLCIRMLISLYSRSPLVQRRGRKGFLRAGRGIAGLALLQAGVQWRLAVVRRAIALCLGYVPSWVSSGSDAAYADCRNASAGIVALLR
jgi:hypothetical protein